MAIGEGEIVKVEVEVEGVVNVEGRGVLLGKLWQPFVKVRYVRFQNIKILRKYLQDFASC